MNRRDASPVSDVPSTTVHEQAWEAVVRAVRDELRAAQNRLATPAEVEPLRQRLASLDSLRRHL